jgi:hypothetical protein
MRNCTLALAALVWLVAGGCLPLYENKHQAVTGEVLGISVSASAQAQTVPEGTAVDIAWSAANLTGQPATVTITLESRRNLSRVTLGEGLTFDGISSGAQHVTWDTTGFAGPYAVIARIDTASLTREDTANGLVEIDQAPRFRFTAPAGDVTFRPASEHALKIAWVGGDESATFRIGVDPDTNHNNDNEFYIHEGDLPTTSSAESFDWNANDVDGTPVPPGAYHLFATATDNVNDVVTVDGPVITLAE